MKSDEASSIQTRPSLLRRLNSGDDNESWNEFYGVYGKLVRDFALKAGLKSMEAEEVVQETAIAVARHLPDYRYDPKVCRFKTWLLNQASWRIKDQVKKRRRHPGSDNFQQTASGNYTGSADDRTGTATIHRIPDPATPELEKMFEAEWQNKLSTTALQRVQGRFSLKQFQIFDLVALKQWPAAQVAKSLSVSIANVYVTRHRIARALKREVDRIEQEFDRAASRRVTQAKPPSAAEPEGN